MAVIITGVRELQGALSRMVARQNAATRTGLMKSAHLLERDIKVSLSITSSTGQEKRDVKGRFAKRGSTSSPPGSPPFLRSGDLRRSIQVDPLTSLGQGRYSTQVGPTVIYGRIQELGGDTGRGHAVHLPPRPYVAPALAALQPEMYAIMKEAWRVALMS